LLPAFIKFIMKNKSPLLFAIVICSLLTSVVSVREGEASPLRPADSLRVGVVIKEMKTLLTTLQDSIIPSLKSEEKKSMKERAANFKSLLKSSNAYFKDTMLADFSKLSEEQKSRIMQIEKAVTEIKKALPEKSVAYHLVAAAHIPLYIVLQELNPDSKIPLLATYWQPYNPNVRSNNQVIMLGAYLNFYLEYRISVGGIEMGPDIVDPGRLVFTFPQKLLDGITEPAFIEVKASPRKQTGTGSSAKFEDHPEQHAYLLVYPQKKSN
jgi:hypothetical protein